MKNSISIIIILLVIIASVVAYLYRSKLAIDEENKTPPVVTETSIKGCYVAQPGNDVYTLNIQSQTGEAVEGRLVFKNFEKDSSTGVFKGTYKAGILLGEYSFNSEGVDSVMQVIFKKSGNNFIRGYGSVDVTGTKFTDLNTITYDPSILFQMTNKKCATNLSD